MSSLKCNQAEVPFYLALLQIWVKNKNINKFTSNDMIQFLQQKLDNGDAHIQKILDGKAPGKFSRSSKVNINYLTFFNENENTIPLECFNILNVSLLSLLDNAFVLDFPTEEDKNFFIKWKKIWSINKYIYDTDIGPIKSVISEAISKKVIWELESDNKINPYRDSLIGTVSKATKQYGFIDNNNDLRTLINAKIYIDFYDIYEPLTGFLDETSCIIKIESKLKQNKIISEMASKNINFNKNLLDSKIKENFFK